jgi:hypothetical protein
LGLVVSLMRVEEVGEVLLGFSGEGFEASG